MGKLAAWLLLSGTLACSRSSAPAPASTSSPVVSTGIVDAGSEAAAPAPDAAFAMDPFVDSLMPVPRAELERFAREAAAIPRGKLQKPPPPDAKRDDAVRAQFGKECTLERTCGSLWGVNCQAEVDGPYYYVLPRPERLEIITTCGGACMGGRCTNCPPKKEGWTCPVY